MSVSGAVLCVVHDTLFRMNPLLAGAGWWNWRLRYVHTNHNVCDRLLFVIYGFSNWLQPEYNICQLQQQPQRSVFRRKRRDEAPKMRAQKKNENCDAVNSSCVMFDDGDDYDDGERSNGEPSKMLPCLLVFRRLTAPFCPFDVRIMLNIPKQTHTTLAVPERIYISHINRDLIGSWRVPQIECEKSETSDKRHSHRTVMHIRSQNFVDPNPFIVWASHERQCKPTSPPDADGNTLCWCVWCVDSTIKSAWQL